MEVLSCYPHSITFFSSAVREGIKYIYTIIAHVFSEMSTFITYLCKITLIFECVIYFTLSIWILISCVLSAVSFVCEGKIYDKLTWTSACRLGNIKYVKKIVIRKKKTKKNNLRQSICKSIEQCKKSLSVFANR